MCDDELVRRIVKCATWKGFPQTNPGRIDARKAAQKDHKNNNYAERDRVARIRAEIVTRCDDPKFAAFLQKASGIYLSAYDAERERLQREAVEEHLKTCVPNGPGPYHPSKVGGAHV